ncbi:hypothetical protein GGI20_005280 [Coemansia sp. BCRC 34301]|nr:hypothetical protein GGI20_005280 [Coemansia sp. BCRC 34301]
MSCPMCNARHVGSVLTLFIDTDGEREKDSKCGGQEADKDAASDALKSAKLLPLYLDKMLTTKCKRLDSDIVALNVANDKCVAWMQKNKLETLPDSYKTLMSNLQGTLEQLKQAIASMESRGSHLKEVAE